jgi:outer membrane protein assembly factor BamB
MAATTCWGVVLCVGLALPLRHARAVHAGTAVPLSPARAQSGAAPYQQAWTVQFDFDESPHLTASGGLVLLGGPRTALIARSARDGAAVWRAPLTTRVIPAADDDLVFVHSDDRLTALDAATGGERWADAVAPPAAPPRRHGEWLLALTSTELRAYGATDGRGVWRLDFETPATASPAAEGSRVFLALADRTIAAIDLPSGHVAWRRPIGTVAHALTPSGGYLYFGGADGVCYALRQADGGQAWAYDVRLETTGAPIADGERVYFALSDATLRAFDRDVGNMRWVRPLDWRPSAGPRLAGGELLLPLGSGDLVLLRADTGRPAGAPVRVARAEGALGPPALDAFAASPDLQQLYVLTFSQSSRHVLTAFRRQGP